ncbi:MAG: hypothetical protein A2Y40_00795 [Candidatus Margulisbacteria bacterium GWF2_35_9]|nr:MAG: hypothetical protein A2Y40_00795 [Candidatus Margulisbacteria bacterium GWF2_35_9]
MSEEKIKSIITIRKEFDNLKSEEDLSSNALYFLKKEGLLTPLVAFITINNVGDGILYGTSEFPVEELNKKKTDLIAYIENKALLPFQCRRLTIFVEETKREQNQNLRPFVIDNLQIFPMALENKLHAVMMVYSDEPVLNNKEYYVLLSWLFQERYFIITKKHQELIQKKIQILNEAREMIYSVINMEDMFSILGDIVLKHAKAEMGFIALIEDDLLEIRSSWHYRKDEEGAYISQFEADFPENLKSITLETKGNLLDYVQEEMQIIKLDSVKIYKTGNADLVDIILPEILFIPLIVRENVIGYLGIIRKHFVKEKFTENEISLLETIVSLAAAAIDNKRLYDQTIKEQITQKELTVAHDIQVGLQAKMTPNLKHFDIAADSIPARVIGGDYYDFFPLEESLIGITLTDIVGKGIPAALIMAFFKGIMQSSVFEKDSPDETFMRINENLYKNKSVKNYIPSVYALLNDKDKTFIYTNAGHENPLYYSEKEDAFRTLEEGGLPLGAFSGSIYDKEVITMEVGDIAILFTDGVTEARNTIKDSYGDERLKDLVRKHKHLSAAELVEKITENVFIFSKNELMHDDLTIVIIKRIKGR